MSAVHRPSWLARHGSLERANRDDGSVLAADAFVTMPNKSIASRPVASHASTPGSHVGPRVQLGGQSAADAVIELKKRLVLVVRNHLGYHCDATKKKNETKTNHCNVSFSVPQPFVDRPVKRFKSSDDNKYAQFLLDTDTGHKVRLCRNQVLICKPLLGNETTPSLIAVVQSELESAVWLASLNEVSPSLDHKAIAAEIFRGSLFYDGYYGTWQFTTATLVQSGKSLLNFVHQGEPLLNTVGNFLGAFDSDVLAKVQAQLDDDPQLCLRVVQELERLLPLTAPWPTVQVDSKCEAAVAQWLEQAFEQRKLMHYSDVRSCLQYTDALVSDLWTDFVTSTNRNANEISEQDFALLLVGQLDDYPIQSSTQPHFQKESKDE